MHERAIAIACQGGSSHAAYTAGVLKGLLQRLRDDRAHRIVGLSGTSGGAICALLAWYGMLKNSVLVSSNGTRRLRLGNPEAILDGFWSDTCTQNTIEAFWNAAAVYAERSSFQIRLSPYSWAYQNMMTWLQMCCPRPEFTDLRKLIAAHVDFTEIEALMPVFALIQRLHDSISTANLAGPEALADWLSAGNGSDSGWQQYQHELGTLLDSEPLRTTSWDGVRALLGELNDSAQRARTLDEFANALRTFNARVPVLLIGAVDVQTGAFKAFSSAKGEVSLAAVTASAAIPWIFEAQQVASIDDPDHARSYYWDGLFSQNPPITDFVAAPEAADEKVDEIFVVQIESQKELGKRPPESIHTITARRNELSGNLSLNQEVGFITAVNRWIEEGVINDKRHKHVRVFRIPMDCAGLRAKGIYLGEGSTLCRTPEFIGALKQHGTEQVSLFLPIHQLIADVLDAPLSAGAREVADRITTTAECANDIWNWISTLREAIPDLHIGVDLFESQPSHNGATDSLARLVELRWQGSGRPKGNALRLDGTMTLSIRNERIENVEFGPLRVQGEPPERSSPRPPHARTPRAASAPRRPGDG